MICPVCGAPILDGGKFCVECGSAIPAAPESAPAPVAPAFGASEPLAAGAADSFRKDVSAPSSSYSGFSAQPTVQAPVTPAPAQPGAAGFQRAQAAMPQSTQPYQQRQFGAQPMPASYQNPGMGGGAPVGQQVNPVPTTPYVTAPPAQPKKKSYVKYGIIGAAAVALLLIGNMLFSSVPEDVDTGDDDSTYIEDGTSTDSGSDSGTSGTEDTGDSTGSVIDPSELLTDDTATDPDADLVAQDEPATGEILFGADQEAYSNITVTAGDDTAAYVKLKDLDGNDVMAFYVRAGETAEVGVPGISAEVYFAQGKTWYGIDDLFGSQTEYSKDPDVNDLSQYTLTYTLHTTSGGNFSTQDVDEGEF